MMNTYTIGVDIGGTNTDAVLVRQDTAIHATTKVTTTDSIDTGFTQALKNLLEQTSLLPSQISGVFVGTTHGTNAILQCEDLFRVGTIRITGSHSTLLPSCSGWPQNLKTAIHAGIHTISGGFECDGRKTAPIDRQEVYNAVNSLIDAGAESIAIVGTFSPINHEQELEVATHIASICTIPTSLSHQLGGIGFFERENSTILNAALKKSMSHGFAALQTSLEQLGMTCPLYVTQNNGTLLSLEEALAFPVLTISAGPTNSFVGSTKLANVSDAIVADIGGTSTDVGIVHNGFARRSLHTSSIGGIMLNFPMPDVLSIGLGGGSHLKQNTHDIEVGPMSCGKRLKQQAYAFGGNTLTLTDAALLLQNVTIAGADTSRIPMARQDAKAFLDKAQDAIQTLAKKIAGPHGQLPLLLTGGASALFKHTVLAEQAIIPEFADVANAYGAALAEISGTIDTVVCLEKREAIIESLIKQATEQAIARGAAPNNIRVVEQEIVPYHYMPMKMARVKITVAGQRHTF
ncbi:hydantoinase/oxoprolinase family protein [Candidatus Dependentiae bacterium]|nr:hydantoinase/oxoprolinase family protein [Candidatus Dependentiae bacterium]